MAKLILIRHLQSQWNLDNRFTGWVDIPLSKEIDEKQIKQLAEKISAEKIDVVYTSSLIRNKLTVWKIYHYITAQYPLFIHSHGKMKNWANFSKQAEENYIPVFINEALNERYYGNIQGVNKQEAMDKYGDEKVKLWRRSFDIAPIGNGESLADVCQRVIPFYNRYIKKDLQQGKNVLVVASHNSLRALVKHIEKIPDKEIINLEISVGEVKKYDFSERMKKEKRLL